jgi:hypothetical protein
MTKPVTLKYVARAIIRGIQSDFAPEGQEQEVDRLTGFLEDLSMSRATDANQSAYIAECQTAERDVECLDSLASYIEEAFHKKIVQ